MKYICSITINRPIEQVVRLWADEGNFAHWQDGFQSIEHFEGIAHEVGSKSKILLLQGKRRMELIETILTNNLPTEKKALYEHIHMTNTQTTRFESISANETRYISEVEYTQFNSLMPKLMAKLFPSLFRNQSQKWMEQFKVFVENG